MSAGAGSVAESKTSPVIATTIRRRWTPLAPERAPRRACPGRAPASLHRGRCAIPRDGRAGRRAAPSRGSLPESSCRSDDPHDRPVSIAEGRGRRLRFWIHPHCDPFVSVSDPPAHARPQREPHRWPVRSPSHDEADRSPWPSPSASRARHDASRWSPHHRLTMPPECEQTLANLDCWLRRETTHRRAWRRWSPACERVSFNSPRNGTEQSPVTLTSIARVRSKFRGGSVAGHAPLCPHRRRRRCRNRPPADRALSSSFEMTPRSWVLRRMPG